MKKIAITGALQLLGYHFCNHLLNQGVQVVGFDNFESNKNLKEEMLFTIGRNANFQFVETLEVQKEFKNHLKDVDMYFHLSEETTTSSDLIQIIQLCDQLHIPVVFGSSLEVYGKCATTCNENTPLHPASSLGKRKKREESYFIKDAERCNRKIAIIRMPNIFGPWQNPNDSFHQLIYQFVKNNASLRSILNDSSLSQHFMYVQNVVDALMLIMNHQFQREIYNLSVNEKKYCSKKIRTQLSFTLNYSFEQGVEILIKHIRKILETNPSLYDNGNK